MQGDKLLIIPIELFQREIYTGLYLGLSMVEKGYDVLICDQLNPILGNVSGGVVFHKDHATWSLDYVKGFKQRGAKVVVHDTEGLIVIDSQRYINGRVSLEVLSEVDAVLCWGESQKALINQKVKLDKLRLAGDLRFDIARKRKKNNGGNREIENILINTRFSYVNPIQKTDIIITFKDLGYLKTDEDVEKFKQIVTNDELIFKEFICAVNLLVSNGKNVIIRPHPAENVETYENIFKGSVKIDKSTSLGAQIDWSDCVVHDGCTTAIEARAQGKVVFGLRPELVGESYDQYANKYSNYNCSSAQELVEMMKQGVFISELDINQKREEIDRDIYNFHDNSEFFVDTFYDILEDQSSDEYKLGRGINKLHLRCFVKQFLYFVIKKLKLRFLDGSKLVDGIEKYEKKFSKLSMIQVQNFCLEIEKSIMRNKTKYQIKQLNAKAFMLKGN